MRAQFVASEIGIGLRRNLAMTIAVVVTTAVSLTFVAAAVLLNAQVQETKDYWYDRVEVSVFLCGAVPSDSPGCAGGEVTQEQREALRTQLEGLPEVEQVFYESKEEAYENFREQYDDNSALVESVSAESLPESYRVALVDPDEYAVVAEQVAGAPGVDRVQDQKEVLEPLFNLLNRMTQFALGLAAVMLVAAIIMMGTTIRLAALSRRRETGIMRLVGASNFYIRLPFVLEGAVSGLVGGLVAGGLAVLFTQVVIQGRAVEAIPSIDWIDTGVAWWTAAGVVVLGVLLGVVASWVTLRRYLRV
ncbi:permease-like cell division protein FtsX [Vallicoccus soli]|uniref:Cell division protein FtsX n=1 Tax=Vallicoccus soli TaxID=2339232 RepID=A0A3A3ZIT2_9ACTN|nr:permease-like cell division protein FtsX [Vallicoccus soli]RJK95446.1 ABC transporter permease [Vallicoccus soli]